MGNRELLAVKLALEEWRHWLEGAELPFIVWTDHKNLAYIQSAKRLNSRQARWALYFGRFSFTLTYRPGSRNLKPDALSRQFASEGPAANPDTILPASCVVAAVTWEIESLVKEAQRRNLTQVTAQLIVFLCLPLFAPRSCSGHTPPVSPVILVSIAHCLF